MLKYCFILLNLFSFCVHGQHAADHFYFSSNMALSFQQGNVEWDRLPGCKIHFYEGKTATISDRQGNLLFYSNGYTIYNRNNQVMLHGDTIRKRMINTQIGINCLALPKPGSDSLYYVVYPDNYYELSMGRDPFSMGLRYSLVNMSLDGGLGGVEEKNILCSTGWMPVFDQIAAVQHSNGKGYWILTHTVNDDRFYAFPVTENGIGPPVRSSTGKMYTYTSMSSSGLKISPDGQKLAMLLGTGNTYVLDLYRFDAGSGLVSEPVSLGNLFYSIPRSIEFSPNSSKFYVTSAYLQEASVNNIPDTSSYLLGITQFDLSEHNQADIARSFSIVSRDCPLPNHMPGSRYDYLQLLPNGKLLCIREDVFSSGILKGHNVSLIHAPDEAGAACFEEKIFDSIVYNSNEGYGELPNIVSSYLRPLFHLSGTCVTDTIRFTGLDTAGVVTADWDFSDPGSGTHNHASGFSPSHHFSKGGNFMVHVSMQYTNGEVITCHYNACIKEPLQPFSLGPDTSICAGGVFRIEPCLSNASFCWQDGSSMPIYKVRQKDTISLQISNSCGFVSDTMIVNVQPKPVYTERKDTLICSNEFTRLVLHAPILNIKYQWNTGAAVSTIQADTAGLYWVDMSTGVCTVRDSMRISISSPPFISLGNDTAVCEGTLFCTPSFTYMADYLWNDGSKEQSFCTSSSDTIWLQVKMDVCSVSDTLHLTVNPLPDIPYLPSDTILCTGTDLTLTADCAGCTYQWQDVSALAVFAVTGPGKYFVTAEKDGCYRADTIKILYIDKPDVWLGNDTILCGSAALAFAFDTSYTSYLWDDGSTMPARTLTQGGQYYIRAQNECGIVFDTLVIHYLSKPVMASIDTTACFGDTLQIRLPAGYSYAWNDGSTDSFRNISAPVQHIVMLNNACGQSEMQIHATFTDCCEPFIPNLITANNDGKNDDLFISCTMEGGWNLQLYSSWGTLIHEENNFSGFLGMYKINAGMYYYALHKKGRGSYTGWVQVIR